jgi:hypothetical protein
MLGRVVNPARLEAATARIRILEADNRQLRDVLERALGEQRAAAILTPAAARPKNGGQKEPPGHRGKRNQSP